MVQCFRRHASTAGDLGSTSGQRAKISRSHKLHGVAKNKQTNKNKTHQWTAALLAFYTSDLLLIHHISKYSSRCRSLPCMAETPVVDDISPSLYPVPRHQRLSQSQRKGNSRTSIRFSICFCDPVSWKPLHRMPVALPLGIHRSPRAMLSTTQDLLLSKLPPKY